MLGATPAGAAIGGRPANPQESEPRSKDIFIYTLKPGQSRDDAVMVTNNSEEAATVELYPVDSLITNTGAFTCKQRVEDRSSVGAWVKLDVTEVTLDAGETQKVPFTLRMPASADVGEHNGCIAFEVKGDEGTIDGNVRIRPRTAVRVVATAPGELKRDVGIESYTVSHHPDAAGQYFSMKLKSTGNVSTDVSVAVELRTLFGTKVYSNEGTYPVLANNKFEAQFVNEEASFWGGWFTASGSISYNSKAGVFGVDEDEAITRKDAQDVRIFIAPAAGAVAIYAGALIILLGSIGYIVYLRREKRDALRNWYKYTVKPGDTIQSIAESRDIGWKKLAKINGIKAPYVLSEAQEIKLPKKKLK